MRDQFSNTQAIRKPAVTSKGGIVAAQSSKAAQVGAEVLAAGGDCVDAVIATTFALGVLEPWMSGPGGGGAMVLYRAREDRYEVIDYGMRAPASLNPADYPLTGGGAASDIFPWPRVKDDRNIHGPSSIAVPGVVAGMEEAHRRHAKLPWKELLAPSVTLAGEGLAVDWWTTLMISSSAADLRRYPASAAAYLRMDCRRMRHGASRRMSACRRTGSRPRWRSSPAPARATSTKAIWRRASPPTSRPPAARCRSKTSSRSAPHLREPLAIPYRGGKVFATPELTAGPTLSRTLGLLQKDLQAGARQTGCGGLCGLRRGAAGGLSRAAEGHGRCRRQALARRGSAGAGLHHAFLGGRPRRQHGGGDADAAVDLRLQICIQPDRHHHEQRHHVVRPDAGHAELAGARQALPDQLHAGAGAGQRWPPHRHWRFRRPAHPAGGDAASVLRDGLRHGPRCGDPPAAHRRQRRRHRDRRCSPAAGSARGTGARASTTRKHASRPCR